MYTNVYCTTNNGPEHYNSTANDLTLTALAENFHLAIASKNRTIDKRRCWSVIATEINKCAAAAAAAAGYRRLQDELP